MTVLVLGFGPFGNITDNPASTLARAIHGRSVGIHSYTVIGLEMPVAYSMVPSFTLEQIERVRPDFTLGIGVAAGRTAAAVERVGRNRITQAHADHRGELAVAEPGGEADRVCPAAEALAEALGVALSDDAGEYVCNAWLYRMLGTGERVAFVHIPLAGMDPDALSLGLGRYLDALR